MRPRAHRGRSERAFGTIQGRLPQELNAAGITDYQSANVYLERRFVPDFNRRFTVPEKGTGCFLGAIRVSRSRNFACLRQCCFRKSSLSPFRAAGHTSVWCTICNRLHEAFGGFGVRGSGFEIDCG